MNLIKSLTMVVILTMIMISNTETKHPTLSKMETFVTIVNGWKQLTIVAKLYLKELAIKSTSLEIVVPKF